MELELWTELSQAISSVERKFSFNPRDTHRTALIVRVHLWSTLHDRPTCWGCQAGNWSDRTRPWVLPDQSTMSRRMRRKDFEGFLTAVGKRLNGKASERLLRIVDGKALEISKYSSDRQAKCGRGVGRQGFGYKLHLICSGNPMPDAFVITPLNVCEKQMAARMIKRVKSEGYLLGDGNYDASWLYDICWHHHHHLLAPRAKPATGIGHHYQSPHRLRAIALLEAPSINEFGRSLYRRRTEIERDISNLTCFGGGLTVLPPWVRRSWRVRRWVWAKLLVNAARVRIQRLRRDAA